MYITYEKPYYYTSVTNYLIELKSNIGPIKADLFFLSYTFVCLGPIKLKQLLSDYNIE